MLYSSCIRTIALTFISVAWALFWTLDHILVFSKGGIIYDFLNPSSRERIYAPRHEGDEKDHDNDDEKNMYRRRMSY